MLGQDDHGIWLGAPAGSIVQRGHEPAIAWRDPFVQLIVESQWWTMIYNGDGPSTRYYVDIITPPDWIGEDRVEFIDLDLDVVMHKDGAVHVLDEHEFAQHRESLGYPDELVIRAEKATAQVEKALLDGSAPFDGAASRWLSRVS